MNAVTYHPLPDILFSDYQSFSGREYGGILLFRIASVNPHLHTSSDIHAPSKLARYLFRDGG
jgi:hypothetical protein